MDCEHDLLVIGGGIHGAGVAQAAAAAGHSVRVLEQYPSLALGSSGRSSKLIHGGLRYLEGGRLALVAESLRERRILLAIAPELVRLVPFHIPVYRFSRRSAWQVRAGLALYSALGGLSPETRFARVKRAEWEDLDGLATGDLKAVYRYYDAQTDDAALTRAVMASARRLGATLHLSARFDSAALEKEGLSYRFTENGREREGRARALVNAAGPQVNQVLATVAPVQAALPVELVQGAHIVVPGRLEKGIYYVEVSDGRVVFAMPWRENILVGTTETDWQGDPAVSLPLDGEIDYLLAGLERFFPGRGVDRRRIVAAFAGLRVLPAGEGRAFSRPRDVVLRCDRGEAPRMVSIYGGKLTTYRATAGKVLARLAGSLPERTPSADTRTLVLYPDD